MTFLVIIPAYNEEKSILRTVDDIKKNLPAKLFDYVVINDCSTDGTANLLDKNNIPHIDLPVNLGLSGAVQTGYKYAYENNYYGAVQFDGDGQHKASYIKDLSEEISKGLNIAVGSRFINNKKNFSARMIGSRIISLLIKIKTGKTITDPTSGMRMLDRTTLKEYAYNMNFRPEPDSLVKVIKKGATIKEIQVEMNERTDGESLYSSCLPAISYMLKMIISIIFLS